MALRFSGPTLLWLTANGQGEPSLPLAGRTQEEANNWVERQLAAHNLPLEPFRRPLDFEIEVYPASGAAYDVDELGPLRERSRYYANAAGLLKHFAAGEPIRCWPHHFDIATLRNIPGAPGRTIGLGMSPGDARYPQPYFYVTPKPYPDAAGLPGLPHGGHWHTQGWTAAVVLAEHIARIESHEDQAAWVRQILASAADDLTTLLSAT